MKLYKFTLAVLVVVFSFSCSSDDDDTTKSNEKQILEFSINNNKAEIDQTNKTIELVLTEGTNLAKLKPEIKISDKASVNPASGTEMDFTNPVKYTVSAEDGSKQEYTVTVTTITAIKRELHLVTKIIEIENDRDIVVEEFTYDEKNRLNRHTYIDTEYNSQTVTEFTYNSNNELSKFTVLFQEGSIREYNINYKDSKTIEVSYDDGNTTAKDIYKVNDKGLLEQFTENPDGGDGTWLKFEYDTKGNIVKITDEEGIYTIYGYDNYNSIFKDIKLPQWICYYTLEAPKTQNNIITIEHYDPDGSLQDGTQTNEYLYNEKGYPVSFLYEYGPNKINYKIEYKIVIE